MSTSLRVLILEDQPSEAELMVHELRRAEFDPYWRRVENESEYLKHLEPAPDVILADYSLPQFDALQALHLMQERGLDVPFIVVTGRVSEEVAVECMKQGAADYLLKDRLARLGLAVRHSIAEKRLRDEKKRAEDALRQSEERFRTVSETAADGIVLLNSEDLIEYWNSAAERIFGYHSEEVLGKPIDMLLSEARSVVRRDTRERPRHSVEGRRFREGAEFDGVRRDGEVFPMGISIARWQSGDGVLNTCIIRDLTEARQAQRRAELQERLAAVGQLAAGIAHDFNNILGTIMLYSQLVLDGLEHSPRDRERLTTIFKQAERGTVLISQILDFSRRSVVERQPMDLLPFLKEVEKLLARTLPETIRVKLDHDGERFALMADPTRMQQMIMNLALNARDAMPDGGQLCIEIAQLEIKSEQEAPLGEMEPGRWVRIRVGDTGTGIPSDVLPHLFEPFFTTKPTGQGTGLGLAQVYGIVKQHDGFVEVTSQEGRGTTFTIYLPAGGEIPVPASLPDLGAVEVGAGESILLVEDDDVARAAIGEILSALNYNVLHASNGKEALAVFERKAEEIDLVLSDMVMPEMCGPALFHALSERRPDIKAVLMTGYPLGSQTKSLLDHRRVGWLQKPFSTLTIARAVREALARQG